MGEPAGRREAGGVVEQIYQRFLEQSTMGVDQGGVKKSLKAKRLSTWA